MRVSLLSGKAQLDIDVDGCDHSQEVCVSNLHTAPESSQVWSRSAYATVKARGSWSPSVGHVRGCGWHWKKKRCVYISRSRLRDLVTVQEVTLWSSHRSSSSSACWSIWRAGGPRLPRSQVWGMDGSGLLTGRRRCRHCHHLAQSCRFRCQCLHLFLRPVAVLESSGQWLCL